MVFRMTAGDPEWCICSLMGLSGGSRKIMTVSDTGIWRNRRVNTVNINWLVERECSNSLGAHGSMLVELSHLMEEPDLSHSSNC